MCPGYDGQDGGPARTSSYPGVCPLACVGGRADATWPGLNFPRRPDSRIRRHTASAFVGIHCAPCPGIRQATAVLCFVFCVLYFVLRFAGPKIGRKPLVLTFLWIFDFRRRPANGQTHDINCTPPGR